MFCPHIYFNGNCREAIDFYKQALDAEVLSIIPKIETGKENEVIHSEILIHDQKLILNDFGDNQGITHAAGFQLVIQFETVDELEKAYSILSEKSITITPKQSTDYSECVVRFIDKFGIPWGLWV